MKNQLSVVIGVTAATLFVAMAVGVGVSAQNRAHGIPTPEKVYGNGTTWPIKVEKRDYDREQLLSNHLSDDALAGRVLWTQRCAFCHDGVGQPTYRTMGPWLGAETVEKFGEDTVRSFILNGDVRMPAFRYGLDSRQVDDLITFLKTVPASQKPTPAQLASKLAGSMSD